jgi:two-component system chemotaxis response regulator CheB
MPKMDGLTFLEKIMKLRPTPVVMVSTLTKKGAKSTIRALEIGAIDCISKPASAGNSNVWEEIKIELITKIKTAAISNISKIGQDNSNPKDKGILQFPPGKILKRNLIAIGASTGGVEALKDVLQRMPQDSPPILVVQHMPASFTRSFAERLNGLCPMHIHEAENGQEIMPGNVYIAPGNKHLTIEKYANAHICKIEESEIVSGHRPSVDVLFNSVAKYIGKNALGVILTGMGKDGASGMLKMKMAGAINIGQSEDSCVVYGMPKEAFANGSVALEVPLQDIAREIIKQCSE